MIHTADAVAGIDEKGDFVRICDHPRCVATWEALVQDCEMPTCIGDSTGKYVLANRAFCEAIGAPQDRVVGSTIRDWFPPEFAEERMRVRDQVLATGKAVKAADVVRGKRFLATVRPLSGGPWQNCVLCVLAPRGPRPDEMHNLHRFRMFDMGELASLTSREMEVLKLIGEGYSQREIAEHLSRTVKTVEAHRAALGRKLNVKKNIQLVQMALSAGLLDTRTPVGNGVPV